MTDFYFRSASEFDLESLAVLYTRTFEGYVYKAVITPDLLASWIHVEDLKLELSPVLCVGDERVGFATAGLRGEHAYCRGFGIVPAHRGKGLATALSQEMVARARRVRASDMVLGVLMDNTGAVKAYRASGFTPARQLHSVEWKRTQEMPLPPSSRVVELEPARALASFNELHPVSPVWNRDPESLRKMNGLEGLAILENGAPCAYVLYRATGDVTEILDLAAVHAAQARDVLSALQFKSGHIVCYNEPEPSPAHAVFRTRNFRVMQRRYEMRVGGLN